MELEQQRPAQTTRRMASAAIVAIGVAIAWGLLWMWGVTIVESWTRTHAVSYDSLAVTTAGEPVIQTQSYVGTQELTYRKLDGTPVEVATDAMLSPASMSQPEEPPRFFAMPIGWGQSLGVSDFAKVPGGWYLLRQKDSVGRAFFVGYDELSKMPIGYLTRQGFSRALPPEEQWFEVGSSQQGRYQMDFTSHQPIAYNGPATQYNLAPENFNLPPWLVFVLDGDRVREVNLRDRTVREILHAPELFSLSLLTEAADPAPSDTATTAVSYRLAVRSRERIYVLDPATDVRREFVLPELLRDESPQVYSLGADQLLTHWQDFDRRTGASITHHLAWIAPDGSITRDESFPLGTRGGVDSPHLAATIFGLAVPIPLGWGAVVGVIAPVFTINNHDQPTYAAALAEIAGMAWPGIIIVLVWGTISAGVVWRLQRKYFRPATGAWCAFAFLLGLPGLFAYWLEMERAKLEACGECRQIVPRDRAACAACETPFAAPPLAGTEIFA